MVKLSFQIDSTTQQPHYTQVKRNIKSGEQKIIHLYSLFLTLNIKLLSTYFHLLKY